MQTRWAEIQYQLPEAQREAALEKRPKAPRSPANSRRPRKPGSGGIITSNWAGAQGGLGALGKAKDAKAYLEKAIALDPGALQGSAYTSLGTLYDRVPGWPIGFGDEDKADQLLRPGAAGQSRGSTACTSGVTICCARALCRGRAALERGQAGRAATGSRAGRQRPAGRDRPVAAGSEQNSIEEAGCACCWSRTTRPWVRGCALGCTGKATVDWLEDGASALPRPAQRGLRPAGAGPRPAAHEWPAGAARAAPQRLGTAGADPHGARATEDRIAGLDAGADDYLVKPFDLDELKARLRALLRRSAGRAELRIEHAEVSLDPSSQQVSYQGKPVPMTPKEYLLLHELLSQPGKVLTRERLAQLLYGWDEEAESNTLEVHIHHLRKKLFSSLIRTVRGVGYLVEEQS